MPVSLSHVLTNEKPLPPKIVLYGPDGVGKTTFACNAPNPIVIRTEDRLGVIRVPAFPVAKDYTHVYEALVALYKEQHTYKTVILDTLDWLEPLIWEHTAVLNGKPNIEDFGFGKGYQKADEFWMQILNGLSALRNKGMLVICIAHSEIKRFESPETTPYDRYQIKLHKRAAALASEWADIIAFAKYEVFTQSVDTGFNKQATRGIGHGARKLALEERPAFDAKNSYAMPAEIPLDWGAFLKTLKASFAKASASLPESNGATPVQETAAPEPTESPEPTEPAAQQELISNVA